MGYLYYFQFSFDPVVLDTLSGIQIYGYSEAGVPNTSIAIDWLIEKGVQADHMTSICTMTFVCRLTHSQSDP